MIDISMQGATLTFSNPKLNKDIVLEFSDEGTPMEFPNLETCGYAMTMNGELVTWTKPTPITFSITVIPNSKSDGALRSLLYVGHVGGKGGKPIDLQSAYIASCTLKVPSIATNGVVGQSAKTTFTFKNGRMTGGRPAVSSNAEGKMSANTYSFVFESVS